MIKRLKILGTVDDQRVKVECRRCNTIDVRYKKSVLEGTLGCRKCGQQTEVNLRELNAKLKEKFEGKIKAVAQIIDRGKRREGTKICGYIKFSCKCGNTFLSSPKRIFNTESGCPHCSRRIVQESRREKSKNEYVELLKAKGCSVLPIETYQTARIAIRHKCSACGHIRNITPTHLLRLAKCTNCAPKNKSHSITIHKKVYSVYGYEDFALQILVKKFKASEIESYQSGKVPQIKYGKNRRHYPDLYVPSKNLLIEVKGPATFGMKEFKHAKITKAARFYNCCEKAIAAQNLGFKYKLMLILGPGREMKLPKDWYLWSFREMYRYYQKHQALLL